jgi:ABC-type transporter Mla MlaB component
VTTVLSIALTENGTEMRLVLHGRLTGASVAELRTTWKAASLTRRGRTCVVELDEVTFIDKTGDRLLRAMSREGARFTANDLYMKSVIENLKNASRHGLAGMIASFLRLSRR